MGTLSSKSATFDPTTKCSATIDKKSRIKHTMGVRTSTCLSAFALAVVSSTIAIAAQAQDSAVVFRPRESVPEATDRTFYRHSESLVKENDSFRWLQSAIGTLQFPENAIMKDSKDVNGLYRYLMERQTSDDPIMRSADLANPFNLSVQTLPTSSATRLNGSEFVFERTPEVISPAPTPIQPAVPMMPSAPEPVQAKF
jgi:hypothetical protein